MLKVGDKVISVATGEAGIITEIPRIRQLRGLFLVQFGRREPILLPPASLRAVS